VEEFIFRLRRSYFCLLRAYRESCIFVLGRFEFSKKSNIVRTRGPRDSKFSQDVGVDTRTCCTQNGFGAMLGFAARWRWKKIVKRDFLRNGYRYRRVSFTVTCLFRVSNDAAKGLGVRPPLWVSVPPNQKFMSGDPEIFWGPGWPCEFLSGGSYGGTRYTKNC